MTTLIIMGTLAFGSSMIESMLSKDGKQREANMVGFVAQGMMVTTCIGTAVKAFAELRKLGA